MVYVVIPHLIKEKRQQTFLGSETELGAAPAARDSAVLDVTAQQAAGVKGTLVWPRTGTKSTEFG